MPSPKVKTCKGCQEKTEVNRKGYCQECAVSRGLGAMRQMHAKKGPFYEKWRTSMRAYLDRTEA